MIFDGLTEWGYYIFSSEEEARIHMNKIVPAKFWPQVEIGTKTVNNQTRSYWYFKPSSDKT